MRAWEPFPYKSQGKDLVQYTVTLIGFLHRRPVSNLVLVIILWLSSIPDSRISILSSRHLVMLPWQANVIFITLPPLIPRLQLPPILMGYRHFATSHLKHMQLMRDIPSVLPRLMYCLQFALYYALTEHTVLLSLTPEQLCTSTILKACSQRLSHIANLLLFVLPNRYINVVRNIFSKLTVWCIKVVCMLLNAGEI